MGTVATTKMSSRGQVLIPTEIRTALGLKAGSQFVVVGNGDGDGDVIILTSLRRPSMAELGGLLQEARRKARRAGLRSTDVKAAIDSVRP
jgi:AbrB family looped-hinge helix DNA binding protein